MNSDDIRTGIGIGLEKAVGIDTIKCASKILLMQRGPF